MDGMDLANRFVFYCYFSNASWDGYLERESAPSTPRGHSAH